MTASDQPAIRILVVDPCLSDYDELIDDARQAGWRIDRLSLGRDALREATRLAVDLWMINVELPDMSGFELVERLDPRRHASRVFLVADAYRAEDEVRALSLGVTRYLCKPVNPAWLDHWRPLTSGFPA